MAFYPYYPQPLNPYPQTPVQPYQDRLAQLQNNYQQTMPYGQAQIQQPMGYHPDRSNMRMDGTNRQQSRYGETYDRYSENRRHYHDSKDADSKQKMDSSMKEYTQDVIRTMSEMWSDADATLRQQMKTDLTKLLQQMN